jgi:S1-C subfamily serine protease
MRTAHRAPRSTLGAPRRRSSRRSLASSVSVGLYVALAVSLLGMPRAAAVERPPGGNFTNPVVRQVDVAAPAVVRIATTVTGSIAFNLCGKRAALAGQTLGGTGSGAFISAHGDVLTADHVVHIPREDLDQEWFASRRLAIGIAQVLNRNPSCLELPRPLTVDDILAGYVQAVGLPFVTSYSAPTRRVWMNTTFTGPVSATPSGEFLTTLFSASSLQATVVGASPFEEDDVAILHVNVSNTLSIQLGDAESVAVQDHLTVIGFPGNADIFHPDGTYDATDLLTPSVNDLHVSAIKSGVTNNKQLQVSGNIEHGDSGGPALDDDGHIVGVVSYGGVDLPVGTFFLRTSNDAQQLLRAAGIDTQPGPLQNLWAHAFADYADTVPGHWHRAAQELDNLLIQYPSFLGAKPYKDYADQAATREVAPAAKSELSLPDNTLALLIAGGGALLALGLLIVLLIVLRRSRRAPVTALPAGYGYYNPYSMPLPGYGAPLPPITGGANAPTPAELLDVTKRPLTWQTPPGQASFASGAAVATAPVVPQEQARAGSGAWSTFQLPVPPPPSGVEQGMCVNGHHMPAGEVYCGICGAARRRSADASAGEPG